MLVSDDSEPKLGLVKKSSRSKSTWIEHTTLPLRLAAETFLSKISKKIADGLDLSLSDLFSAVDNYKEY